MPSIVHEHEIEAPDRTDEDAFDREEAFRVESPEETDEVDSADAACELILDVVEQQFWEWYNDPVSPRRFKPRVKVYEVSSSC